MLYHVVFEHTHSVFKSRVIVFAWGDVTCAAYPESNDCVLLSLSSSTVCTDLRCLPAGDKQIKDQLLCAPRGGVGHRAALLTSISEAFLPELGAGHSSADPEGCSMWRREAEEDDGHIPRWENTTGKSRASPPTHGCLRQRHSPWVSLAELRAGGGTLLLFPTEVLSWVKPSCANTPHSSENLTCLVPHPMVPWPPCLAPAVLPLGGARSSGHAW